MKKTGTRILKPKDLDNYIGMPILLGYGGDKDEKVSIKDSRYCWAGIIKGKVLDTTDIEDISGYRILLKDCCPLYNSGRIIPISDTEIDEHYVSDGHLWVIPLEGKPLLAYKNRMTWYK